MIKIGINMGKYDCGVEWDLTDFKCKPKSRFLPRLSSLYISEMILRILFRHHIEANAPEPLSVM